MADLNIEERQIGDVTVLELDGRLIFGDSSVALYTTRRRLIQEGKKYIVMDLRGLGYVDSSGIYELVVSYTELKNAGGLLRLCNITEKIKDLLTITKLLTVFDTYESVQEAVASISSLGILHISCPVHGCGKSTPVPDHLREGVCPGCETKFAVVAEYSGESLQLSLKSLRLPTYEGEYITISPGNPTRVSIAGRLDLFASEVLERAWLTIPLPRYVVFELEASSEMSSVGIQSLMAFCAGPEKNSRAVVLARSSDVKAVFPADFTIYDDETEAIAGLGEMTSVSCWTLAVQ